MFKACNRRTKPKAKWCSYHHEKEKLETWNLKLETRDELKNHQFPAKLRLTRARDGVKTL